MVGMIEFMKLNKHAVCCLVAGKMPGEVSLNSMEWAVITQIDGERTVEDIAKKLTFSLPEAIQIFNSLIDKGLIEVAKIKEIKIQTVSPAFFNQLEKILITFIGPVATYVINDTLMELNAERSKFPETMVPELVELLSEEISDEAKKIEFQKQMLNLLKRN